MTSVSDVCSLKPACVFPRSCLLIATSVLALGINPQRAFAQAAFNPIVTKLQARPATLSASQNFGDAMALSDRYIVCGHRQSGAAYLYDARTGRFLRKLIPSGATANSEVGYSVAVGANLVVVSTPNTANGGIVYGFHAATGKELWKLNSPDSTGRFGDSVALSGDRLLVGDGSALDAGQTTSGKAYVYDITTSPPSPRHTLGRATDAAPNSLFGGKVALCGRLAVVGRSETVAGTGFTYVFDTETGARLHRWIGDTAKDGAQIAIDAGRVVVTDSTANDIRVFDAVSGAEAPYSPLALGGPSPVNARLSVAISGNLAVIGATGFGVAGQALLLDLVDGTFLTQLKTPNLSASDAFGYGVALCGNRVLIGAPGDDDLAVDAGAVYYYRSVAGPSPLDSVAKKGDFAPGVLAADFAAFQDVFLGDGSATAFCATLTNRAKGIFGEHTGSLGLMALPNRDLSGLGGSYGAGQRIASVFSPIAENSAGVIFRASLSGTGVSRANNQAILKGTTVALSSLFRTGDAPLALGGGVFNSFPGLAQRSTAGEVAVSYQLAKGTGGVSATTDSGVYVVNNAGVVWSSSSVGSRHREGERIPSSSDTYAQFSGRVAFSATGTYFYFPAFFVPDGGTVAKQALFFDSESGGAGRTGVQGGSAPGLGGPLFNLVLGETVQANFSGFRSTLTGPGTTSATNEGIFSERFFTALRKGAAPNPAQPSVVVSRFLGFWVLDAGNTFVILASLKGPGIKTSNDIALYLVKNGGLFVQELAREGDPVCGADLPRLGTIQRVDVDTLNGNYVILASLTGNASANQALLTGRVSAGNDSDLAPLRKPILKLRKGTAYQAPYGATTTIRALSLSATTDRGGAGARGQGQVINTLGEVAVCVQFDNLAKEVLAGKP